MLQFDLVTGKTQDILKQGRPADTQPHWMPARVHYSSTNEHEIIIRGRYGNGASGFVAVDDIQIFEGDCDQKPTPPPQPTPMRKIL